MATWFYQHGGQFQKFQPVENSKIEEGFLSFWQCDGPGRLQLDEARACDFQVLALFIGNRGSPREQISALLRCEQDLDCGAMATASVEWGYGQDIRAQRSHSSESGMTEQETLRQRSQSLSKCGPYSTEVNSLLEESFTKYRQTGSLLKGVFFTSSNGADYLVDFKSMQQLRIITRRSRMVYRHAVGPGVRGHADVAGKASPSSLWAVPRPMARSSEQRNGSPEKEGTKDERSEPERAPKEAAAAKAVRSLPEQTVKTGFHCFPGLAACFGAFRF